MAGQDITKALEDGQVGPDEPVVTFARFSCRGCDAESDWFRSNDPAASPWDLAHKRATGHSKFYLWSITRQTSRIF